MKQYKKTIYKCDFCPKYRFTKKGIENHETFCKSNPVNNSSCFHCSHLDRDTRQVVYKDAYGEHQHIHKMTTFECKLLDKKLYSYVAEKKKLLVKHPDSFKDTERMPSECPYANMSESDYQKQLDKKSGKDAVQNWLALESKP